MFLSVNKVEVIAMNNSKHNCLGFTLTSTSYPKEGYLPSLVLVADCDIFRNHIFTVLKYTAYIILFGLELKQIR